MEFRDPLSKVMTLLVIGSWVSGGNGQCDPNFEYRAFDGTCNNLNNPSWGSAEIPFRRILAPQYEGGDGNTLRGEGRTPPLPFPRTLSYSLSEAIASVPRPSGVTLMTMTFGQLISHDMMNSQGTSGADCQCVDGVQGPPSSDPNCKPLNVSGDPFFSDFGTECLPFTRQFAAEDTSGPRNQVNRLTSFIDASTVYGVSEEEANNLRSFCFGKLRIGPETEEITPGACTLACPLTFPPSEPAGEDARFLVGDGRAEQHPALTSLHIFFVRVHNDIAQRLAYRYPFLSDETLFQETRRYVIAIIQHITYDEYLPVILGKSIGGQPNSFGRRGHNNPHHPHPSNKYDENLDPSLSNVFSAAAYRFGHSLVSNLFELPSGTDVLLEESFGDHDITLTSGTHPSDFVEGLSLQESEQMDHVFATALRDKLFADPPFEQGTDLYSRNIKRGRDRGIPPYVDWRSFCGLRPINDFSDLRGIMPPEVIQIFTANYETVDDIDLYPAGIAELPKGDGILGPTFTCLLEEQFNRLRFGDRFFYDNRRQPKPFKRRQIRAIEDISLADLICNYAQIEVPIPPRVLEATSPRNQPRECTFRSNRKISDLIATWM